MNKMIKKSILTCLGVTLLVSCGTTPSSSSSSNSSDSSSNSTSSDQQTSNTSSNNSSTSSIGKREDNGMSLFMYGDLFKDGMRTIYAKTDYQYFGDRVIWESSDDTVISVSSVSFDEGDEEPYLAECLLTGKNYGTATITAYLEEDVSITASLDITISEGVAMDETLFKSFSKSVQFTFVEQNLSYDEDYVEKVDETYDVVTIFEENYDPNSTTQGYYDLDNYTDAYQLTSTNRATNKTNEYKYVRSKGNQVAKERIGLNNNIDYELLKNSDGNTIKFDNTYYINPFGQSYDGTYKDWRTFDNGKTYHFTGSYIQGIYICASLLLEDMTPDDMWFTINDDNSYSFNISVDPYNQDKLESVKYGKKVTGTISKIGTATIDHISVYTHESYHDGIQTALDNMANLKNYKVSYDVTYPTASDSVNYVYTYTEDTIDYVITSSTSKTHKGIHKKDDGTYYEYTYDETNQTLTLTKSYDAQWDAGNGRYPTFAFASEIFADQVDGYYTSRSNNGVFINYCVYAPAGFTYYSFDNEGSIKLDGNGYISNVKAKVTAFDEDVEFNATFSDFNSTSVDLDFSNIIIPNTPTSWEEDDNKYIAGELDDYNMKKYLPYMYIKNGWSSCGYIRVLSVTNSYVWTKPFDTEEELESFITSYGELLVENGYTKTEELDENNNNGIIYTKDDVKVSIGKELNWNNVETLGAKIFVYASDLVPGGSSD